MHASMCANSNAGTLGPQPKLTPTKPAITQVLATRRRERAPCSQPMALGPRGSACAARRTYASCPWGLTQPAALRSYALLPDGSYAHGCPQVLCLWLPIGSYALCCPEVLRTQTSRPHSGCLDTGHTVVLQVCMQPHSGCVTQATTVVLQCHTT